MRRKNLQLRLIGGQTKARNSASSADKLQPKKGFVMLFSVLISSMLVVIGLSIFNITLKELTISTSGRESQVAFYAANSGIECGLYWNLKQNAFASSTNDIARATAIQANCNGIKVNGALSGNPNNNPNISAGVAITTSSFAVTSDPNGPCSDIVVKKTPNTPSSGKMTTIIESRGKNICGSVGRRVERGLKATIITDM